MVVTMVLVVAGDKVMGSRCGGNGDDGVYGGGHLVVRRWWRPLLLPRLTTSNKIGPEGV